jgi:hypothetical protein
MSGLSPQCASNPILVLHPGLRGLVEGRKRKIGDILQHSDEPSLDRPPKRLLLGILVRAVRQRGLVQNTEARTCRLPNATERSSSSSSSTPTITSPASRTHSSCSSVGSTHQPKPEYGRPLREGPKLSTLTNRPQVARDSPSTCGRGVTETVSGVFYWAFLLR